MPVISALGSVMLVIGFCSSSNWGSSSLFLILWEFYHESLLDFYKTLHALIDMIMWFFFFFSPLIWWITLVDFQILNQPWTPGINSTWSWHMIFLIYCWIHFSNILLSFVYIHKGYWSIFSFLYWFYQILISDYY
jgi:hypothetical protein